MSVAFGVPIRLDAPPAKITIPAKLFSLFEQPIIMPLPVIFG
ncbi:hypothetical protein MGSAQ_002436 [marine sediment metagenome]|uniref:Uncharacterized protein n=1 Tax=marine sediment metagenome TaxID=412755 RepID=A0A1B6NRF7_9ZZZZ